MCRRGLVLLDDLRCRSCRYSSWWCSRLCTFCYVSRPDGSFSSWRDQRGWRHRYDVHVEDQYAKILERTSLQVPACGSSITSRYQLYELCHVIELARFKSHFRPYWLVTLHNIAGVTMITVAYLRGTRVSVPLAICKKNLPFMLLRLWSICEHYHIATLTEGGGGGHGRGKKGEGEERGREGRGGGVIVQPFMKS